jgi:hypothetical protein
MAVRRGRQPSTKSTGRRGSAPIKRAEETAWGVCGRVLARPRIKIPVDESAGCVANSPYTRLPPGAGKPLEQS